MCLARGVHVSTIAVFASMLCLLLGSIVEARQMVFPGEAWETASPESEDINSLRLSAAIESLGKDFDSSRRALAIARNGTMVWQSPGIESTYPVRSITKSFTSTALGLLIDDGAVSLNTKVATILPVLEADYPDVTFAHLATMTSGYHADYIWPWTPLQPYAAPGTEYNYENPPMDQMSNAMTQVAGEPIADLFQRRIGDPIGITTLSWPTREPPGSVALVNRGGDGLYVSTADAARLGHLFLNRGDWDGQQLLSANWVDEATRIQVPIDMYQPPNDIGIGPGIYGYNWWISGESPGGWQLNPSLPDDAYFASGDGDNLLFVVPQWDLVVAKTANSDPIDVPLWDAFFRQVRNAIAPVEGGKQIDLAPTSVYSTLDESFDGNGDSAIDLTNTVDAEVGEVDTADSNHIARVIAKFSLPAAPAGKPDLAKASLAFYSTESAANLSESLSIWHSTVDNVLELSPATFEDSSYTDTLTDIVHPGDNPYEYYAVDVTDIVLADYAADGDDPLSAFRLQIDEAAFLEDDISHHYSLSMSGAMFRPQLLLTFVTEGIGGDYNDDGVVSIADYTVWRNHLGGPAGILPDDVDGGTIGIAQYNTWKTNFGATSGLTVGSSLVSEVAEPANWLLSCVVFAALGAHFRRR